jgi:hypothetical protein
MAMDILEELKLKYHFIKGVDMKNIMSLQKKINFDY